MRLKIYNGTTWPDPTKAGDSMWTLRHNIANATKADINRVLEMASAYSELVTHPAFTLHKVGKIVSSIRKAIKAKE